MKRIVAFIAMLLVSIGAGASISEAKNLHRHYGGYWNCSYITYGTEHYAPCAKCEAQGMEYDDRKFCVPKDGASGESTKPAPQQPSQRRRCKSDEVQKPDGSCDMSQQRAACSMAVIQASIVRNAARLRELKTTLCRNFPTELALIDSLLEPAQKNETELSTPADTTTYCTDERFTTTKWCTSLAPYRGPRPPCISGPSPAGNYDPSTGKKDYSFSVDIDCTAEIYLVAVKAYDGNNCTRSVEVLSGRNSLMKTTTISSTQAPEIIDIIVAQSVPGENHTRSEIEACFRKRHSGAPCACVNKKK